MADVGFEEFYMNFEELIENADDDIKEVIKQMKLDYSILKKEAHANAKDQKCLLCGADCTSFCNSHSIPQFILKNVSNNFVSGYGVLKNPLSPPSGVKNALVFKNICNKCDNTKFQQYENISIYDKEEIPVEVLREISLKDYLFMSHKRRFEKEMLQIQLEMKKYEYMKDKLSVEVFRRNQDLDDYKMYIDSIDNTNYKVILDKELCYSTKFACQTILALVSDCLGQPINNIYSFDPNYHLQFIHVCVFPLAKKTRILLFTESNNDRYDNFSKQLSGSSDWLYYINYMIMLFSEDWVIPENLKISNSKKENTYKLISRTQEAYADFETKEEYQRYKFNQDLLAERLFSDALKPMKICASRNINNFLANRSYLDKKDANH